MEKIRNQNSGKYIGYLTSIEGSAIVWADDIDEIKSEWCFGMTIFESDGLDSSKLKEIFPQPPERGIILDYFKENLNCVFRDGHIIGEIITKRSVITEKT